MTARASPLRGGLQLQFVQTAVGIY